MIKFYIILDHPASLFGFGTDCHLWFLSSLIFGIALVSLFLRRRYFKTLFVVTGLFYIFGVLAGAYSLTIIGFPVGFNTRDLVFFCSLPLAYWAYIGTHPMANVSTRTSLSMAIGGMFVHFVEVLFLNSFSEQPIMNIDYVFGTIIWSIGLFHFALSKNDFCGQTFVPTVGKYALGIYLLHMQVVPFAGFMNKVLPALVFLIIKPFFVFAVSLLLVWRISKVPRLKWIVGT